MGFAYGKVTEATSTFTTNIDGLHTTGRMVLDRAFGGSGFGLDLGAAAKLNKTLTASFGISNLLGKINWNKETKRSTFTFSGDSVSVQKLGDTDLDSVFVNAFTKAFHLMKSLKVHLQFCCQAMVDQMITELIKFGI